MIKTTEITAKEIWEQAVTRFPQANFLHSWNWGQFQQNLGKTISRIGFYKVRNLVGIMLSIVETAKRATYLTIAGGPLMDWKDNEQVTIFKDTIIDIAKQHHCSFIRVRPQILNTQENQHLFASLGFHPSPMHLHAQLTHQLDLTQSKEKLLSNMRKNTRYEIKQAQKLGIKVTTSNNPEAIEHFWRLQLKTAKRHNFVPFSKQFLYQQFKVFAHDNQALLYTATFKKELLVQAIIIFYGVEADYHYSASTQNSRNYPGAYALQWKAIKDAKKQGMHRYNLWGVAPTNVNRHRFYGVSVFKRGFRGTDIHYLLAHDLIINPFRYSFNWVVEQIRKRSRGL